ncbi:S8 family serine peptidase [bacterium]|nr:S8 family serine peptidase [bacterium]
MKRTLSTSLYIGLFFLSLIALEGTLDAAPVHDGDGNGYQVTDHYLVKFEGDEAGFRLRMRAMNCKVDEVWPQIRIACISDVKDAMIPLIMEEQTLEEFVRDVSVDWVNAISSDINVTVQAAGTSTDGSLRSGEDAEFYDIQWGLQQIKASEAWKSARGDRSVRVGVLDTGISPDHVDLKGKYDLDASINLSASNPADKRDFIDRHYHGTHVSALISSNNLGVAGIAPDITLVGVKVLDDEGRASFANLIAGIMYAVDVADVDVINLSAGGLGSLSQISTISEMLHAAIDYAERHGVAVVASAGNAGMDLRASSMQSFVVTDEAGTLLVSASGPASARGSEKLACYSNYGSDVVGLAAPGGSIDCNNNAFRSMDEMVISALAPAVAKRMGLRNPDGWYMFSTGTSMAAPLVSGLAALVKSEHPDWDATAICEKLKDSADDLGLPGKDGEFGYGRINAELALK